MLSESYVQHVGFRQHSDCDFNENKTSRYLNTRWLISSLKYGFRIKYKKARDAGELPITGGFWEILGIHNSLAMERFTDADRAFCVREF